MAVDSLIVVGGGPAGMMAAYAAAEAGAKVTLLEKKGRLGNKLRLTGNGRCNLTHVGDIRELIDKIPGNGQFLWSAFHSFGNEDLIEWFNSRGLYTTLEPDGRVFPRSNKADEVCEVLENSLKSVGAKIIYNNRVKKVCVRESRVEGVDTENGLLPARAVVVATGGCSYPWTGSSGEGYTWASNLGHTVELLRPALVPMVTKEGWVRELKGLAFSDTYLIVKAEKEKLGNSRGELIFTHFGISGPAVLNLSRVVSLWVSRNKSPVTVEVDLEVGLTFEEVENKLVKAIKANPRRKLVNVLGDIYPLRFVKVLADIIEINGEKRAGEVGKKEIRALGNLIKRLPLTILNTRSIREAYVTAGGINVNEINPQNMESKLVSGLFFAGEVLDVDGLTGGYNLQAAFSTGYVAGKAAADYYH